MNKPAWMTEGAKTAANLRAKGFVLQAEFILAILADVERLAGEQNSRRFRETERTAMEALVAFIEHPNVANRPLEAMLEASAVLARNANA